MSLFHSSLAHVLVPSCIIQLNEMDSVHFETTVLLLIIAQPASLEIAESDLDSLNWDFTTISL